MSVTSTISVVKATATSLQKVFDISDIEFFLSTEIRVYANSVELFAGFTTNVLAQTVTFVVGRTAGDLMVFQRDLPETQAVVYTVQGKFPAASHEEALDRGVMLIQELQETQTRTLSIPVAHSAAGTFNGEILDPGAAGSLGNVIALETDGLGFRYVVVTPTDIVTPLTTRGDLIRGGTGGAAERVALGTSGQYLKSDGTDAVWAGPDVPSGTVMVFYQNAAPTGWTILATENDKAFRVVSSAGGVSAGTTSFTTVFVSGTTGATTLSTAQTPAHDHDVAGSFAMASGAQANTVGGSDDIAAGTDLIASVGGGSSHTHTTTLDLQYIDVILATRDA